MGPTTTALPVRPLSRYQIAATSRADEAASFISSTYCGHQIRFPDRAASLRFRLCEAPLARISVGALSFDAQIGYDLGETEIFYLVQIAASGTIRYINGNELLCRDSASGHGHFAHAAAVDLITGPVPAG